VKVGGQFDLTYCSNIHAGETWDEVFGALSAALPAIRQQLAFTGPFGIGLRLSAAAARSLESPDTLAAFRAFLHDGDYYVPTINGFPYGAFHGTRVKERVYLPDWRSDERVDYSNRLARILATLTADRVSRRSGEAAKADGQSQASVSTVPGAFRTEVRSSADRSAITERLLAHAAYLKRLHKETGVRVTLAIEPEPACVIETTDEALAFFRTHLLRRDNIAAAGRAAGLDLSAEDVTTYLGVCLDTCHMAVEFEDVDGVLRRLQADGIGVYKVQLSSALRLHREPQSASPRMLLGRFADDTYLHQVVICGDSGLTRYTDLPEALAEAGAHDEARDEWRVHFHVPVFLGAMSGFDTTQSYLKGALEALKRTGAASCLEVETYTWDVLPPEYRTVDVRTAIARELAWVRDELGVA
jgi:sugar phosphate isomerase/epimerase